MTTLTAAALKARTRLSEKAFMAQVIQFARLHRWRVAHFRPARTATGWRTAVSADGAGWPDLFLVRGEQRVAAELKVGKNKLTPEQEAWLMALNMAGIPAFVWTPDSWPTIQEVLTQSP